MANELKELSSSRCFDGYQKVLQHSSKELSCDMKFGIYLPDNTSDEKLPVLFFLSGLTCTQDNFIQKSGFQRFASANRIIVVNPDTSTRVRINGDDDGRYGQSASFYVDATAVKWSKHYRMYSYVAKELVQLIFNNFSIDQQRCGIFGHSMGGHGAIIIGLRNPSIFASISAFAPICDAPSSAWGQKAFSEYFGTDDRSVHNDYSAAEIAKRYDGNKRIVRVDLGTADQFLAQGDLNLDALTSVSNDHVSLNLHRHNGYDHGYYFIATFIDDHFAFHVEQWSR